jgi:uncharacterized protein
MMKFLCVLLIALGAGLGGIAPCASQTANNAAPSPEALEVAKEVLSFTTNGDTLNEAAERITAQVWPSMAPALRAKYPDFNTYEDEMRAEYKRVFLSAVTEMLATNAPAIYARMFSVPEMRDLIAFYRTSTGAKFLKLQPQLAAETTSLTLAALPAMIGRLNAAFEAVMRNHGVNAK